jgi:hypothetical protein
MALIVRRRGRCAQEGRHDDLQCGQHHLAMDYESASSAPEADGRLSCPAVGLFGPRRCCPQEGRA